MYHVQNVDRNVSHAEYKQFGDKLLVTSIFRTIQGEGPLAGTPCVFVRLAGCNRGDKATGCEFCDTAFHFAKGEAHDIGDLITRVRAFFLPQWRMEKPLIVVTGGEPMLQANLTPFVRRMLANEGWRVQIESNGDRLATGWTDAFAPGRTPYLTLVVSPKVQKNGHYRMLPAAVEAQDPYLKFVIDAREGSPYERLPIWAKDYDPNRVYLSPLAVYRRPVVLGEIANAWDATLIDRELTERNYQYAARMALELGYRLSIQSHLFAVLE